MNLDFKPHKPDRMNQVNELLKHEVAELVQRETQGKFVTITEVDTARDLKNATIWASILNPQKEEIIEHLNSIAYEFQSVLGKKLDLRNIPKLYFKLDTSGERAARVDQILDREKKN